MNRVATAGKVTLSSVGRTMAPACFLGLSGSQGSVMCGRKWDTEYLHCLMLLDESQTKKEEKWLLSGEQQEFVYLIQ